MDTKINFIRIGIFVIVLFCSMLIFIFWLGKYGFEKKRFNTYTVYFTESVSGLNIESPVKYKGLEVGVVENIKINEQNSEEIEINIKISKETPIKQDNFAILGTLGLTGLKYVELKGGSKESPLLKPNNNGKKIIESRTSIFETLENSTEDITRELELLLIQSEKLLSNENIKNLSKIFETGTQTAKNIENITSYLSKKEDTLDELLKQLIILSKTSSSSFDGMKTSALTVKKSATTVMKLSKEVLIELKKGTYDIKSMTQDSFQKLNIGLEELEDTLIRTQVLIDNLDESPSDLIFKQKNIKLGPGELK